jgi:hypothetical protein
MKDKCEGCKRAKGSDAIYTCNCGVDKKESIEEFLKKLKINGNIKWTLNQNTSTEKEINLKDLLQEYATQQAEQGKEFTFKAKSKMGLDLTHPIQDLSIVEQSKIISDEEIEKEVDNIPYYGHCTAEYKEGFEVGAKWMRNKLPTKKD